MAFSRAKQLLRVQNKMVLRNKRMARLGTNKDFLISHPSWVQQASGDKPNYTDLEQKTKLKIGTYQINAQKRRLKLKNDK